MDEFLKFSLKRGHLKNLLGDLQKEQYLIIGPTVKDKAIVYDFIDRVEDLPLGRRDDQNNGHYRLHKTDDGNLFSGFTVGFNSIKQFIYPPRKAVLNLIKENHNYIVERMEREVPRLAIIGMRSCELAALGILDKILTQGTYIDHDYHKFRSNMFVVAVNCTSPGNTCFCDSMNTGPAVSKGFDLALTEIDGNSESNFIATAGSEKGLKFLQPLSLPPASEEQLSIERSLLEEAKLKMGRKLSTESLQAALNNKFDDPYWEEIAGRCLGCGNCTMVCPTCFCINFEDETDIFGKTAVRLRKWDSCYNREFSYIHGGSIRYSGKSRYRQWLMHKLSYWNDQFNTFGCVGCGRCITWCPVGIDIAEEANRVCK